MLANHVQLAYVATRQLFAARRATIENIVLSAQLLRSHILHPVYRQRSTTEPTTQVKVRVVTVHGQAVQHSPSFAFPCNLTLRSTLLPRHTFRTSALCPHALLLIATSVFSRVIRSRLSDHRSLTTISLT